MAQQPAPSQAQPNPLFLPVATTTQTPNITAYNALNVPGLAHGATYLDPVTGVKIWKLTDSTFPSTDPLGFGHDYAEGGHEISLPHTGTTRTILVRALTLPSTVWWLIDFTPGVGVSNQRQLPVGLAPAIDNTFSFSSNPATPFYAYTAVEDATASFSTIHRFDIRTLALAEGPGTGWPVVEPSAAPGTSANRAVWLHGNKDDTFWTWMRGANGPTVVSYVPATGVLQTQTLPTTNEPRVDREGRYIQIVTEAAVPPPPFNNSMSIWDTQTNTITWSAPGDGGVGNIGQIPFAHQASLRRLFMGLQYNCCARAPFWNTDPSVVNSSAISSVVGGAGVPQHSSGNWVQPSTAQMQQWATTYFYGGIQPTDGKAWLFPGGIEYFKADGTQRALAHPYNTQTDYHRLSFAKPSPDGFYLLFTSDMNGQPRSDVFMAELPTTVPTTVPNPPVNASIR